MKPELATGQTYAFTLEVTEEMQACFDGRPVHPLYATASMIQHMERAARQLILPYLEPGEEGVGCGVDVRHLAPARIGAKLTIRATITEIRNGSALHTPKIISRVEACHGEIPIGAGFFTQAIVPVAILNAPPELPSSQSSEALKPSEALRPFLPDASQSEPDPATLISRDGHSQFHLSVLRWETAVLPCTRYDEWLVCRADWNTPQGRQSVEGPFLLLYELELWHASLVNLLSDPQAGFLSDFLESVLSVRIMPQASDVRTCAFRLEKQENAGPATRQDMEMTVEPEALRVFATGLECQLAGFLSRL